MLMDIAGKPLIERVIERAIAAEIFDDVLVATSDDSNDDELARFCNTRGIHVFRGSLNDVLSRYWQAAESVHADVIARLTGDCPLLDPEVIRAVVTMFHNGNFSYVSNVIERTFPDGLDTEIFSFSALEAANQEARLPSEREHVTPFIHKNPQRFAMGHFKQEIDLSVLRWTVDEKRDLEFVRRVFTEIGKDIFSMEETLALLQKKPDLQKINEGIPMNEGMQKSLEEDKRFLKE
jgi:spore coat polysaccharide biosynthesis protein SpsF